MWGRVCNTCPCTAESSPNHNPSTKAVMIMLGVIVVLARTRDGQWIGRSALARRQEADLIDFGTIAVIRIGTALNVVRDDVVVGERDAAADGDRCFKRDDSERRNRHACRTGWGCGRRLWRRRW